MVSVRRVPAARPGRAGASSSTRPEGRALRGRVVVNCRSQRADLTLSTLSATTMPARSTASRTARRTRAEAPRQAEQGVTRLCYRAGQETNGDAIDRPGTAPAGAARRNTRGHAPRHREGEPARAPRRRARAHAASGRARLGAHASAHHHRLQRVAARARHRRACQRRGLPRRAHRDPPVRLPRASATRCCGCASMPCGLPADDDDPDRPLRHLQRRAARRACTAWASPSLRPAHADDLGHSLQLVAARASANDDYFGADPQFPPPFLPAALPLRRLAGGVLELRRRPRARAAAAAPRTRSTCRTAPRCAWGGWATRATRSRRSRSATTASRATAPRCRTRSRSPIRRTRRSASATPAATTTSSRPACCRSRTSSTGRSGPSA